MLPIYANVPVTLGPNAAPRCISPTPPALVKCRVHTDNNCVFMCTKCVALLCDTCFLQNTHSRCPVVPLDTVAGPLCGQIKKKLSSRMTYMKTKLKHLHRTLVEKKQRLLEKRTNTAVEIEKYFKRLQEKLQENLKAHEKSLIKKLNDSVNEQDGIVSQNIEKCSSILHSLGEKHSMLDNLDRIYSLGNGNSVNQASSLSRVSEDVNGYKNALQEFEAARDAFLVLRFFVNTETEHTLLNSKVACMEVLNSRSGHHAEGSLESERIAEASSAATGGSAANRQSPNVAEGLAADTNVEVNASSRGDTGNDSDTNSDVSDLVFLSAQHVQNVIVTTASRNTSNRSPQPENNGFNLLHDVTDAANTNTNTNADNAGTSTTNSNVRYSPRRDNGNEQATTSTPATTQREEPPPPYPGMQPVDQPGPGETPPPYPGPPPPPYRQFMDPQLPIQRGQLSVPGNAARGRSGGEGHHRPRSPFPPGNNNASGSGPIKTFSTSELNDKRSAGIFAMVAHNETSFLIIDRWNKKLKYFNDTGASKGGLLFRQEPWDITKVTADIYAVTVPDSKTIYKVRATVNDVATINTVATERKYACISYHNNSQLFVCGQVPQFGEPVIDLISVDGGPIILTFNSDMHGQSLFSYPRYTRVSSDGTAVVCDWNMKCLVVFKLDGTVVGRYRGSRENPLNDPMGIVINQSTDSIYVIDSKSRGSVCTIHRLSLECKMEEVIRVSPEIRDTRAIACAGDKIITGSRKGIVHVFTANESHVV